MVSTVTFCLIVTCALPLIRGLPLRGPPPLDEYEQRMLNGSCPFVDCMPIDRQLDAEGCPWSQREFAFFKARGTGFECRGCRVCVEPTRSSPAITNPDPSTEETQATTSNGHRATTEEDEHAITIQSKGSNPDTTSNPGTTKRTDVISDAPTDESTQGDTTVSVLKVTTGEISSQGKITEGVSVTEKIDPESTPNFPGPIFDPLRNFKAPGFMDGWVDDGGLMAFGDDDAMMAEFLNTKDSSKADDDLSFLFHDSTDSQDSNKKDQSTQNKKGNPEGSVSASTTLNSLSEEEQQRILDTCPSYDCATVEYNMECVASERERTFIVINGVKCEACRRCKES